MKIMSGALVQGDEQEVCGRRTKDYRNFCDKIVFGAENFLLRAAYIEAVRDRELYKKRDDGNDQAVMKLQSRMKSDLRM